MVRTLITILTAGFTTFAVAQNQDVVIEDEGIELSAEAFANTISTNAPEGAKGMIIRVKQSDEGDLSKAQIRFTDAEVDASSDVAELWKVSKYKDKELTGYYYPVYNYFRITYYYHVYYVPVYFVRPVYYGSYIFYTYAW